MPGRLLRLAPAFVFALGLAACSSPVAPEDPSTAGLFDDSPLLPALTAADAEAWQWVPMPGMRCRTGTQTGFGLRRAAGSRDLLIVLQGGGACFDFLTCLLNPSRFGASDFNAYVANSGNTGVFADRPDNPFQDWNVVFVPYCTGDVHSGDAPNTPVPGTFGRQDFVGLRNMDAMLRRIAPEARRAEHVVLSGESAGGFGTIGTYGLVAERLAPAPVDFLDDSGPAPPDDGVFSPALQGQWMTLWNLDTALPDGCAECNEPDGLEYVLPYYAATNPARAFGLLSYRQDAVIRFFFGGVGAQAYEDALFGIRPTLPANAGTYFVEGDSHTFIVTDQFYTTAVEGVPLAAWVEALLAGQATDVPANPAPVAPAVALAE